MARRSASESRNSAGMVNVPQRGMSPACGGKMSVGGLYSRNRGGSLLDNKRVTKDPRALGEKTYQTKCITALAEFLVKTNFPYSADVKKLMSPSKKDFERIFEFLYSYWDPKFAVTKIEDDATKILKMLNYPFIVTKSTFVSVNRMTWPSLLGILMWLMELNKFAMSLDISPYFQMSDFDTGEERYKFLMYNLQNYSSNVDDPDGDLQFFTSLLTSRCTVNKSTAELEREYLTLKEKLSVLQKEEDGLKQAEKDNDVVESNILKYDNFLAQMQNHSKVKEQECLELAETLKQKEMQLQQLMQDVDEMEEVYKQQGYDGKQRRQFLLAQKQNLSKELEEKSERLAKEEKAYWELEMEKAMLSAKVLTTAQEFNEEYAGLKSVVTDAITPLKRVDIPSAIKLCQSFEFDLPEFEIAQTSATKDYPVLKGQIMPALDKLKAYLVQQKDLVNDIKAGQNNWMHELEMKMSELKIKIDLVKAQSVQKQREKDSIAKDFEQEISRLQEEQKAVEATLEEKQKYLNMLEKQIVSSKEKMAANNAKIHESRTMYGLYRTKAKEVFQKIMKHAKEEKNKYDEIQALFVQHAINLSKLMKNVPESSSK